MANAEASEGVAPCTGCIPGWLMCKVNWIYGIASRVDWTPSPWALVEVMRWRFNREGTVPELGDVKAFDS